MLLEKDSFPPLIFPVKHFDETKINLKILMWKSAVRIYNQAGIS